MVKSKIKAMVTSLETDTNDILRINNLTNKFHMYTTDKVGFICTIRNDQNFKSTLQNSVKNNRYIICIYLKINNLYFTPSLKPEIFKSIYNDPIPKSGPTSGSGNINPGTGPGTQLTSINLPPNLVTGIEDLYKEIQKHMTKQPNIGIFGAAKNSLTTFNLASFPNDVKCRYLEKGNPQIIMTGDNMKTFNTGIFEPLDPNEITFFTQQYHLEPPVNGDYIFTRDGAYFKLIKQYYGRYRQFVSNMPYFHGSSPTDIRIWYESVTINSATHGIHLHQYYCFRTEENYSKGSSAVK